MAALGLRKVIAAWAVIAIILLALGASDLAVSTLRIAEAHSEWQGITIPRHNPRISPADDDLYDHGHRTEPPT